MRATLPPDTEAARSERSSLLNELTLIYLTLAYETDRGLDEAEIDAITTKVREWVPQTAERDVDDIVHEAMYTYVQSPDQRVFVEAVEAVGRSVPERQRKALLLTSVTWLKPTGTCATTSTDSSRNSLGSGKWTRNSPRSLFPGASGRIRVRPGGDAGEALGIGRINPPHSWKRKGRGS